MPRPDTYNEGIESFTNYKERLDAFIIANDIAEGKQTATLLSSIGAKTYNTLRSLTAPDLPSSKGYEELCGLLTTHFCPPPLEIVERFKFHKRNQDTGESIAEYIAAIKRLSEHCNFGAALKMSLRDRFVCGIKDESIQKRLLQEDNLTFDAAMALALAMETAHRDAAEIHGATGSSQIHKINKTTPQRSFPPCQSCGKTNHKRNDCFWRDATCKKCSKKGHIQNVCHSSSHYNSNNQQRKHHFTKQSHPTSRYKERKVHELDEFDEDNFTLQMYQISSRSPKLMTDIIIDKIHTSMEIDTGSAVSVMTLSDYVKIFGKRPVIHNTNIRLKTYTGEIIHPFGTLTVSVEKDGQKRSLPLLILHKGSNPILGRDWLRTIKIDWHNINKISNTSHTSTFTMSERLQSLTKQFADVFSDGIGKVKGLSGTLNLKQDAIPKFCKSRPIPYAFKQKVEKELDNLEHQEILSKVKSSDWATPIVPVMKENGDVRICGDFKITVNPALEAEQYTLPRMEDMLATLEQGKSFSKIDLRQAYLHLELDESSKKITTINTSKGLYSYNRLPFGITSSPAIWQKTMDNVLQGVPGVQCNQDDMIITGKSEEDHYQNLCSVLQRLQEYGLKANLKKCKFFQDEVIFCGIKISAHGLHKTDDKINAVKQAPRPDNKSQLRSFLGLVNYYHKWLENIATVAKPLYDLLQNSKPFTWSAECEKAFTTIKEMVSSDKVLIRYDQNLPLRLATDASPYGIGAVLSHVTDKGEERPVAYASRTLNSAEQNYSQLDKEALSIVWAVKKFFNYLCGRHFTLITDHQPLKFIFSPTRGIPPMSAARQQRYALFLSGFNYNIEYRNSKANANADGLSRLPLPTTVSSDAFEKGNDLFYADIIESIPVNTTTIVKESRHDPIISKIINFTKTGNWPSSAQQDNEIQPYFNKRHELSVQQDCLLWGYRLIPPTKLQNKILTTLHVGHLGVVKMKNMARGYFWWPGIDKQIETITKGCNGCCSTQPDPLKAPLHPWQWPEKPWQRIHIDYAGPFMNSMFLVVVDAHSKWAEIIPTSAATTTSTINILTGLIARFGLPEHLVSDNGPQFTSAEFQTFVKSNGMKHIFSPPYHPATNGLAERMVQTFKHAMKASQHDKGNLYTRLNRFLLAYRNAPHATTNESPSYLMFGRQIRNHLDIIRPTIKSKVNAQQQQQQINSHSQANERKFNTGDNVLVRDYRGHQRWQHGTINKCNGSRTYNVEIAPGILWKRHSDQIVHTKTSSDVSKPMSPSPIPPVIITSPDPSTRSTDSTQSGRAKNSTRPQVELTTSSPTMDESPHSPSLSDPRSQSAHSDKRITHTTRSGRVVRKPTKYTT